MKAMLNGTIIAESDKTVIVENNHYFPPDSVQKQYLEESPRRTTCPWKGVAHYFHVAVDGVRSENAAWSYPQPKEAARQITGHVAFWKDVQVMP